MKVLVTGGAGFIGSHTVDKLIDAGAEVIIIDNLSTGKKENINRSAQFYDISVESEDLSEVFETHKPDFVIHLAAQVSVPRSIQNPLKDCSINITGGLNVLENCHTHGVKKIVFASSAAVYGNPADPILTEKTPTGPLSHYGVSKLATEHYLYVYKSLYDLDFTVLRYANVYGPRQDALGEGGVVAIFADKIVKGQPPVIHGDGEQTRDFIYVEDVAEANIKALSEGRQCTLNVGTGLRTTVNELFSIMSGSSESNLEPFYGEAREGDIRHSCMNISAITDTLKWRPLFRLEEGLARTMAFYLK